MNYPVLFGWVAALLTIAAAIPQFIKVIKTKSTEDLSMASIIIVVATLFMWVVYGIYLVSWPLIIGDLIPGVLWVSIMLLKIKYDKKR